MAYPLDYASARRDSHAHWLAEEVCRFVERPGRWWVYYMAVARVLDATFDPGPIIAQLRVAPMPRSQWTFVAGKDVWQAWVAAELAETENGRSGRAILVSRTRSAESPDHVGLIGHLRPDYPHPSSDASMHLFEVTGPQQSVVSPGSAEQAG